MHLGERLTELIDGRLDPLAAAEVERHLEACAECRAELDALREARALVRQAEIPQARTTFWEHLLVRLAEEHDRMVRRRWIYRITIPGALALAAAAVVAFMPVGLVPIDVDAYVYEHARYRALHQLTDEATVTLVSTDASLGLEPEVYGR